MFLNIWLQHDKKIHIYIYIYKSHPITNQFSRVRKQFFETKEEETRRGGQESREREGRGGEGRIQEAG